MPDSELKPYNLPKRLCSEIQLFDLCDLDSCNQKNGGFCTVPVLLGCFEKIAEDELRASEPYISEEVDDAEEYDGDEEEDENDEFTMENFESGEDDGWEDEE